MSQVIAIIKFVAQLIPAIIAIIKSLEDALPQTGLGTEKLAMIRQIFEEAYKAATEAMPDIEKVWAVIKKFIDIMVGVFNKTGTFTK
jgi:hypothetical protein